MRTSTLSSIRRLMMRIHRDECGAVSLEHVLVIGAVALPILVFVLKFGWPRVREYFFDGVSQLETETDRVVDGS